MPTGDQENRILAELRSIDVRQKNDVVKIYGHLDRLSERVDRLSEHVDRGFSEIRQQLREDRAEWREENLALNAKLDKLLERS